MTRDRTTLTALQRSAPTGEGPPVREPSVRFTVDLPESKHHALKMFALESRMSMSDVFRALVKQLMEDEALAASVRHRARR